MGMRGIRNRRSGGLEFEVIVSAVIFTQTQVVLEMSPQNGRATTPATYECRSELFGVSEPMRRSLGFQERMETEDVLLKPPKHEKGSIFCPRRARVAHRPRGIEL